ncbi:MAG TPA: hypothetical protein ENJ16_04135, partial [Planctomycetaceae bacterium]|nr:hypothetical protein [Planctomycetaceae bacterium]
MTQRRAEGLEAGGLFPPSNGPTMRHGRTELRRRGTSMELLLFSDLHRDREAARALVDVAQQEPIDVAVGAGDFASVREGLEDVLTVLQDMPCPVVLVPGNAETDEELRRAVAGWDGMHVLHGQSVQIEDVVFFGLGGAVPVTPFGAWSFDLDEETAAAMLEACPSSAVLVTHAPPFGAVDTSSAGKHLGSRA